MAQHYTVKNNNWSPEDEKDVLYCRNVATRLEAIVDSQPDCVKVVSSDYKLLEMNIAGLNMIDLRILKRCAVRHFLVLLTQNILKFLKIALMPHIKAKQQKWNFRSQG